MKALFVKFRALLFLLLALSIPFVLGASSGVDSLLMGNVLGLLPAAQGALPTAEDQAGWREACYRLLKENAELRSRLLALGDPARLKALDQSWWEQNPIRVEARVVARDASPFRGSLVLSVGAREGIREGSAVLVGDALLGVVAKVGPRSCQVRLLTDPGMRVWAAVQSEKEESKGYVEGSGEDEFSMHLVRAGAAGPQSPVFTAGGDGLLPRGLLLGRVRRIDDLDRNGVAEITVAPAVDPRNVGIVNILSFE